jgi:protein associated with RNAse G/E
VISRMEQWQTITIQTFKYDGSRHRRWSASLLSQENDLLVLDACFNEEIRHDLLGTIEAGTISLEYYWFDRWYNVFRFSDPLGTLRNFYCNINVPPAFDGKTLSYVDLDIDVLVEADFSYRVLDLDEFEQNSARYKYPDDIKQNAKRGLADLVNLIEAREFPFNAVAAAAHSQQST